MSNTQCPSFTPAHGKDAHAFSLIELLVVLGIIVLLLAIAIPTLYSSRSSSQSIVSQNNLRTLGLLTVAYANDNNDLPPVMFQPIYGNIQGDPQYIELTDGTVLPGFWFSNSTLAHVKFNPTPTREMIRDPRAPGLRDGSMTGAMRYFSDYKLTDCLYAQSDYWNRNTQRGPVQWKPQRLGTILFPAAKGFAYQDLLYNVDGYPNGYPGCCVEEVTTPLLWADMSSTLTVMADLNPGEPNFWHHGHSGPMNLWSPGVPVDGTPDGVRGRDR